MKDAFVTAMKYYGMTEVPGPESNPVILGWIKELFPNHNDDSTLSWCSVFIHQVVKEAGYKVAIDKNAGLARSWLKYGVSVHLDYAEPGDIVVLWRGSPSSWQGHVAFFVNERTPGTIRLLGGNQENAVNIRTFPKDRVLGIRRLIKT